MLSVIDGSEQKQFLRLHEASCSDPVEVYSAGKIAAVKAHFVVVRFLLSILENRHSLTQSIVLKTLGNSFPGEFLLPTMFYEYDVHIRFVQVFNLHYRM